MISVCSIVKPFGKPIKVDTPSIPKTDNFKGAGDIINSDNLCLKLRSINCIDFVRKEVNST